MQLDTARLLVQTGTIRSATLMRGMLSQTRRHPTWTVFLQTDATVPPDMLEGARGTTREWADLDRAVEVCRELGLGSVTVQLS